MLNHRCLVLTVVTALTGGVRADVVFVDDDNCPGPGSGSGRDPYCSIQVAIDMAADGDEILVAAGTYFETVNFQGKAVTLRSSDGPDVTIIDAQRLGTVITCNSGEGPDTVIEGFAITGGTGSSGGGMRNSGSGPTVTGCTFSRNGASSGAGMYNTHSSPMVVDCSFVGNTAGNEGGGMLNRSFSNPMLLGCSFRENVAAFGGGVFNRGASEPTLIRCLFSDNTATGVVGIRGGGGMGGDDSSAMLIDCTFEGNHATSGGGLQLIALNTPAMILSGCTFVGNTAVDDGGGIYVKWNDAVVDGCTFIDNAVGDRGGAIHVVASESILTNCRVVGNTAAEGGGMHSVADSSFITNCVFEANSATSLGGGMFGWFVNSAVTNCTFNANTADGSGGATYYLAGNPVLVNCSFHGNLAVVDGGAMRSDTLASGEDLFPGSPTLVNCVVWGGHPDAFAQDELSTITVLHSDIQGGWPGAGNMDVDPMFVDPAAGDLHLLPGSPCIDAGNNWGVMLDVADMDADGDTAELMPQDLDGNPRFAGDNAEPDPGCGVPVVVDMGAYELPGLAAEVVIGDLSGDGIVGFADMIFVTGCIGSSDPDCCVADLDLDGFVGPADRNVVLSAMIQMVPVGTFSADCNDNSLADFVDIQVGTSLDCNDNGIPDECDIAHSGSSSDCNRNGVPDECDITGGTSIDRDGNGIPDECKPVSNDTCAEAIAIVDGTTSFATVSATTEPQGAICQGIPTVVYNDVWFLYTAGRTGIATFSVCNDADFDTVLAIYFAGSCTQLLNPLACNDNVPECGETSEVQQLVAAGFSYLVRIGGADWGDTGVGTLTISCEP